MTTVSNVVSPDEEQRLFLNGLASWSGTATPQELRIPANRKQDRARQKCKRLGLATFADGYWHLTECGRAALRSSQ